jgi:hypothetical protein
MRFATALITAALALATTNLFAAQPFSEAQLDPKNLAQLEERAQTPEEWRTLAQMWEARAAMLQEKAERHDRLEQRYAAAPKSLIAKRGQSWNTPKRQAELAEKARTEAQLATERAGVFIARVDAASTAVD